MIEILWLALFIAVLTACGYSLAGVVGAAGTLGYCCGWVHRALTAPQRPETMEP